MDNASLQATCKQQCCTKSGKVFGDTNSLFEIKIYFKDMMTFLPLTDPGFYCFYNKEIFLAKATAKETLKCYIKNKIIKFA